ncbi:hypothetical protein QFC22_006342 [Naganishia vaughanmartiniae]|uniref:Uncharacterized protein n=1 Tax=Naganishia vaughanmartiniae TaxID=1424756 RepID=A0ACC2WLB2_9TREE|nr:hypothetical protein QFC22_006342 [Naganishia vaughanmartiniae]
MSQATVPAPKRVLAHRIDESTAANYDLLVTYASSIPKDRLLPLEEWLRRDRPTGNYQGPKPTYQLKFDWNADDCPVEVINRAMERCFGARGLAGWEVWIRGDQLILLVGDFRKGYLRLKASTDPEFSLLDLWINGLLDELKRIYDLPIQAATTLLEPASIESQHRRSSRSPSRPFDSTLYPRVLPTENSRRVSKSPSPAPPPMSPAIESDHARPAKRSSIPLSSTSKGKPAANSSSSSLPPSSRSKAVKRNAARSDAPSTTTVFPLQLHTKSKPYVVPLKSNHLGIPLQRDGTLKGKSRIPPGYAMELPSDHESDGVLETNLEAQEIDWADIENPDRESNETQVEKEAVDDEELDADEEDDDDEDDEYEPEEKTKKNKKKNQSGDPVIDLSSGESDPDDAPIFLEHAQGPARQRKAKALAAKKAKAPQSSSFQSAREQLRGSSADRPGPSKRNLALPITVPAGQKRKAAATTQIAPASKRKRVTQTSKPIPYTPDTTYAPESSQSTYASTPAQTATETDMETPTQTSRKGKESKIWLYYVNLSEPGDKNKVMRCRACGKPVKGQNSSNFLNHQRLSCKGLGEAIRLGMKGICCDLPAGGSQATIGEDTSLVLPYNHNDFLAAVMKWIIVSGLPFTTIQNQHLQRAFIAANPAARLQSARSLCRKIEDTYDIVSERVTDLLRNSTAVIHYTHDSWTDSGKKNSYIGIYASFINKDYEYKEYLVRLLHMQGTHSGERIGDGLFNLFSKHLNIAGNLGPGTADNASNNITAAERLAVLLKSEYSYEFPSENLMGCVCHIANLAALAYLEGESTLDATEYAYAQENIPEIRVMGQSAFWNPQLAEGDGVEEEGSGDTGAEDREDEDLLDIDDDEEMLEPWTGNSPVDLVHQLGVFVHASPKRRAAFEKVRADRNPDTPKGLLPLKDVATRWNSKEAAISRVLRLRETVEYFTTRAKSDKCPRFNKKVFDALLRIQPTLQIFLQITLDYSEVGANAYRVLPDLVNAIDQITEIHEHPSVSTARKRSAQAACAKLSKYLERFLQNNWLCAAFALDPTVRQDGLWSLMCAYDLQDRYHEVVDWIEHGFRVYADEEETRESEVELVRKQKKQQRVNKFASERFKAGHQEITHDMDDPWACYNSTMTRFAMKENETVLGYWKRMSEEQQMLPLARLSRDILGLAASSASVERLFSHAGHVLGRKRGSLSTRQLSKQVMLRMWELQGLVATEDFRSSGAEAAQP